MNVHLTRQQEHLIQRKVKTGKYQSPEDEYEQITDAEWREDIRQKIDKAIGSIRKSSSHRWRNFCH
jgi:antitoxin ParD1/3/4